MNYMRSQTHQQMTGVCWINIKGTYLFKNRYVQEGRENQDVTHHEVIEYEAHS